MLPGALSFALLSACSLERTPFAIEGGEAGAHAERDAGEIVRVVQAPSPAPHTPSNDPRVPATDAGQPAGHDSSSSAAPLVPRDAAIAHVPASDTDAGGAHTSDDGCHSDADCNRATPFCDAPAHACVECISHDDCPRATAAQCNAGHCQPCSANDACSHIPGRMLCGKAASAGTCVACVHNSDCRDLALPECNGRACVACTSQAACSGRPGTRVCDLPTTVAQQDSGDDNKGKGKGQPGRSPGTGACVECTAADESACGDGSCDAAHTRCKAGD